MSPFLVNLHLFPQWFLPAFELSVMAASTMKSSGETTTMKASKRAMLAERPARGTEGPIKIFRRSEVPAHPGWRIERPFMAYIGRIKRPLLALLKAHFIVPSHIT